MDTNETTKFTEETTSDQLETPQTQDGELSEEELETVDGGIIAVLQQKNSPAVQKQQAPGIIAILIGL